MMIKCLNLIVSRVHINRKKLGTEHFYIFFNKLYREIAETKTKTSIYEAIIGVSLILHVKFFNG